MTESRPVIVLQTITYVAGLRGQEIYDFLTHPEDRSYQRWWLGTHLRLHLVGQAQGGAGGGVGSEIHMDEYIGSHRLRMNAVITEARPGRRLSMRMKKLIRLPATLTLEFEDDARGVRIVHTVRAGYAGAGRILDPLLRLHFTPAFAHALDQHVHTEFARLGTLLHGVAAAPRDYWAVQ